MLCLVPCSRGGRFRFRGKGPDADAEVILAEGGGDLEALDEELRALPKGTAGSDSTMNNSRSAAAQCFSGVERS